MNIYGVYDKKAEAFDFIFTEDNDDTAVRPVYNLLQRGDSKYLSFPDDFAIYKLASFNVRTGNIYSKDMKSIVCELRALFTLARASDGSKEPSETEATPSVSEDKVSESEVKDGV